MCTMIQENKNIFLNFLFLKLSSPAYEHLTELKKELAIFGFYHPKTVNTHRLMPHQLLLPSQPVKCAFTIGPGNKNPESSAPTARAPRPDSLPASRSVAVVPSVLRFTSFPFTRLKPPYSFLDNF